MQAAVEYYKGTDGKGYWRVVDNDQPTGSADRIVAVAGQGYADRAATEASFAVAQEAFDQISTAPPPPLKIATLGAGPMNQTDGKTYTTPQGELDPDGHVYTGTASLANKSVNNGPPWPENTGLINCRFGKKPDQAIHPFKSGTGGKCSVCGRASSDILHQSVFKPVLAGQQNWMLDVVLDGVKSLGHEVWFTFHHEFLEKAELMPDETPAIWGDAFSYCIDYFSSHGVTNAKFVSCPFGSQYVGGPTSTAAKMHTEALLPKLDAVGADIYFTPPDIGSPVDLRKNKSWAAFTDAYPDKDHILLESALWNGTEQQQVAFLGAIGKWYDEHENFAAFYGFFREDAGAGHDGRLIVPGGVNAWTDLVASDIFGRVLL